MEQYLYLITIFFMVINLLFFVKNAEDRQAFFYEKREWEIKKLTHENSLNFREENMRKKIVSEYREKWIALVKHLKSVITKQPRG